MRYPCSLLILSFLAHACAEDTENVLLVARRAGRIEVIDLDHLANVGSLTFDRSVERVGTSADGRKLYIELSTSDGGCCGPSEVDLETRKISRLDDRWRYLLASNGTSTWIRWNNFQDFDTSLIDRKSAVYLGYERLYPSPEGRWLFGVGNWQESVLDIFDASARRLVRRFPVPGAKPSQIWPVGAWMEDRFLLYVQAGSTGTLWEIGPQTPEMGLGTPVALNPGSCRLGDHELIAAGGRLFLFEIFRSTLDRRRFCDAVPGGAYRIEPSTGAVLHHVAPLLHFWGLILSPDGRVLYGLDVGDPDWQTTARLVKIDAENGSILGERLLDKDVWHLTLARLRKSLVPHETVAFVTAPH